MPLCYNIINYLHGGLKAENGYFEANLGKCARSNVGLKPLLTANALLDTWSMMAKEWSKD